MDSTTDSANCTCAHDLIIRCNERRRAAIYPAGVAGEVLINVFLKRNHAYSLVSMFNARTPLVAESWTQKGMYHYV